MKDYASLRKQNKSRAMTVAALALCVILTASMLFSRLMAYAPADTCQYIPLTKSNGITHVTVDGQETVSAMPDGKLLAAMPAILTANPGFQTYDENTVWQGETEVEIFRISYDNENGEITVNSDRGDKVLAPGTGNLYEFALKNTGNVSLNYTMSMEAYFSNEEYPIPVNARVVDYQGNYLTGSADQMSGVMMLNQVEQSGVIAAGNVYPYTLEWQWPYESGNDAYDTMLGNLAVGEDISLTIIIRTAASFNSDPDAEGGIPPTGDTGSIGLMVILMICSMAGILLLMLLRRKGNTDEEA